jgi:HK97 family phage major capsid protein
MEENLTPEQVVEKISNSFNEKMLTLPTKEEVDSLKSDVDSLKGLSEKTAEINMSIAKFEGKLEAMVEKGFAPQITKNVGEQITDAYMPNLNTLKKGESLELEVKDVTINTDYQQNTPGGSPALGFGYALQTLEPQVSRIARARLRLRDVMNVGATSSKFVTYISQTVKTSAAAVAEAGAKLEGDISFAEISVQVKKIAGYIKVSKEMLEDLLFVRNEINVDLMASVDDQLEQALLTGSGTGNNLSGVYTTATAWSAGSFALTVPVPNIADVVLTAVAQIESNYFTANCVVLHPRDVARLSLTKTNIGEYTYGSFVQNVVSGTQLIGGLPIVASTYMTEGTFLVGDFTKAHVRMRNNMNVQVGFVNDDFQKNMVSIIAELRAVSFVKTNDLNAFVKGTIANAITALTKP